MAVIVVVIVTTVGFSSPNTYIQMSIVYWLIHFERYEYLPLDLTFSCLLPLLKYHFSPFTPNGECSKSIFLYFPNKLVLRLMSPRRLLLPITSLLNCPNPQVFCLFCCCFVADGEKSAVWRWKNDSCLSVLFSRRDLSVRTYSRGGEGGGDHQGEHVLSSICLLHWETEAFLYLVASVLKVAGTEFYFLFSALATIGNQPQNLYANFFFIHINNPKQFSVVMGISCEAGTED